ncbi:MAG: hypothetical protein ACREU5_06860 [Burkholderiales bacterium]
MPRTDDDRAVAPCAACNLLAAVFRRWLEALRTQCPSLDETVAGQILTTADENLAGFLEIELHPTRTDDAIALLDAMKPLKDRKP